jgi:hypothetical protein
VSVLLTDAAPTQADRIRVVGLLEQGCTPQHVLNGTHELLARAIHEAYLTTQATAGHTRASNESMAPWEALPESLRESNRRQADHIVRQLEDRQCTVAPLRDWDEPLATFTKAEIEQLARAEHERWMQERALLGWTYAGSGEEKTKSVGQKRSPYLVEWDLLPAEIRRIDYEAVEAIPAHLARVGLGVYRRDAADVSDGSSELALS